MLRLTPRALTTWFQNIVVPRSTTPVNVPTFLDESKAIDVNMDVGRYFERMAIDTTAFGYFLSGADNTHAGAGAISSQIDIIADAKAASGLTSDLFQVYICALTLTADSAVFGSAVVMLNETAPTLGGNVTRQFLLGKCGAGIACNAGTIGAHAFVGVNTDNVPVENFKQPVFVSPLASELAFLSTATGAGVIRVQLLSWVGPRGSTPPGMM